MAWTLSRRRGRRPNGWAPEPRPRLRRPELSSTERTSALDAYGSAESAEAAYASLRKRGRHIQVGLLAGAAAFPRLDLGRAIAEELEIRGSHGMAAHDYPAMLARIAAGDLDPGMSIGGRIGLNDLPSALAEMSAAPTRAGFLVAEL